VQLKRTYGPWEMVDGQGPAEGVVSVSAIGQACAELLSSWESSAWKQVPENAIPTWITVDGVRLNAAQFLRLMAEAFLSPSVDGNLNVKTCQMFHGPAMVLPTTRRAQDTGTTWTIKPARLGPF
jgi:hypothetical protein